MTTDQSPTATDGDLSASTDVLTRGEVPIGAPFVPGVDDHPVVVAVREVARDLLAPAAQTVDGSTVPRSHLDALAAAGVFGLAAPASVGGSAAPSAVVRRVNEVLAGADASTWFVQTQHHSPMAMVAASPREDLARELASGRQVAGVAFSHLRRWPSRPVTAEQDGDAWRFSGTAPWYTGWGLNNVAVIGAATIDGEVVFGAVPAVDGDGLLAGPVQHLAALQATRTVTLELDGFRISGRDVVLRRPIADWLHEDAGPTANPTPGVLGVTQAAIDALVGLAERRGEPAALAAAGSLARRLAGLRLVLDALLALPPHERTDERLALRAQFHELMVEATTALVVAGAGGSMALTNPAQRLAREALFLLVQAQTAPARRAALVRVAERL